MRLSLVALTAAVAFISVACSGPANPVSPSAFTAAPAGLDRVVEGGGGGGFICIPGPCPETGSLRIDAGDADLVGLTQISQSDISPSEFVASSSTLLLLAGHVTGSSATIEVTKGSMAVSLSLTGPNGDGLDISGEAEPVQRVRDNTNCASKSDLVTEATFIFKYIGRTVISEVHCIAPE